MFQWFMAVDLNFGMLFISFQKYWIFISIFCHLVIFRYYRELHTLPMAHKDIPTLHNQFHVCWWISEETMTSATMVLTQFSRNIPVIGPERFQYGRVFYFCSYIQLWRHICPVEWDEYTSQICTHVCFASSWLVGNDISCRLMWFISLSNG